MNEGQNSKKGHFMPYLDELKDIETSKKLIAIKERYVDKLITLRVPMIRAIDKFDDFNVKIENHWKAYGKNYDINPELSTVPILQASFSDYITLNLEKEKILVDFIKELLRKAQEIKEGVIVKRIDQPTKNEEK
ncbi:hypothetical protein CMI43_03250 [Candidatus Pacearchaeota archaeon]|nr:hypothetical protein [Candidatus Pacearchaeota archaeon]|tara:strand:- start:3265 stop:3666 length:402 start_codon:yes stop_codon:yes gene_type:complete